jgi:hypothetical protein
MTDKQIKKDIEKRIKIIKSGKYDFPLTDILRELNE